MFSDTFNSHHVEEVVELVCVVSESRQDLWVEVTGKADLAQIQNSLITPAAQNVAGCFKSYLGPRCFYRY